MISEVIEVIFMEIKDASHNIRDSRFPGKCSKCYLNNFCSGKKRGNE